MVDPDGDWISASPAVELFSMMSDCARRAEWVSRVEVVGGEQIKGQLNWRDRSRPAVTGVSFVGPWGRELVLINVSSEPADVVLRVLPIDRAVTLTADQVDRKIRVPVVFDEHRTPIARTLDREVLLVGLDGKATLPAYSFTVIRGQ
ncbi:hypothetical protein [Mucisphaera calidilacus]|uniref:Uncharacterized protein n=1 Tax=Mucisphaera calidilacus TaxID=2527982 RepID=A0A518BU30_9BACT|nr:hypothetical protein [Mucisphaera calidilacus]QDU70479.1 hypothetical protein Pan265_03070 [Mucisphaera calidilacus]